MFFAPSFDAFRVAAEELARPMLEGIQRDIVAPTAKQKIFEDGPARLYRFVAGGHDVDDTRRPLLLVPSIINRWYVLDLRSGASVAAALVGAGLDVYLLDWGIPRDEDRHLSWDAIVRRLGRFIRRVCRHRRVDSVGLLGYCVGGTLSAIASALDPNRVAALVNLAGPIDFSEAGRLAHMVDRRWFDAEAIAAAGNVSPQQMQSGFVALRPTAQLGKWVTLLDRLADADKRDAFIALESWASDNIPFPAAAYATYIRELYQDNRLVTSEHRVDGQPVDLSAIRCPVLTIGASADTICPMPAAEALNARVGSERTDTIVVPGGHVGAVVGSRAARTLYPQLAEWLLDVLRAPDFPAPEEAP